MSKSNKEIRASLPRREAIIHGLKTFHGLPPEDTGSNICAHDGYFARGLEQEFGAAIVELEREVGWAAIASRWEAMRQEFMR